MENRFYNRDFEDFVKQNADQYRMFPSEKIWENIHSNLHSRRKWYGIGLVLLLLTAGTVTWVMLYHSAKGPSVAAYNPAVSTDHSTASRKVAPALLGNTSKPEAVTKHFISSAETLQQNTFALNSTENNNDLSADDALFAEVAKPEEVASINPVIPPAVQKPEVPKASVTFKKPTLSATKPITPAAVQPAAPETAVLASAVLENKKPGDLKNSALADKQETEKQKISDLPLTIESVVNAYQYKKPAKKLSWEIFVTPTITYRRLSENKDFITNAQTRSNSLNYTAFTSINNLVSHKPDIGLQFGVTAGYPLFKNMELIGGLQFNVSKYDIGAYYSNSEVATIALNNGPGATSVSTTTNYRNIITNGGNPDWIRNMYFTASAPVGIDWKPGSSRPTRFGVRITGQPTYILSDKAYVLSTDYKNYAEVPSLIRKFNINTGIEAYVTYKSGNLRWKIGPQARFQARSSFKSPYPVRERLFDFGLKIGVMLK